MARIPQYFDTAPELRPTDTGAETLARAGRIVKSGYAEEGREIGGAISSVSTELADAAERHFGQQDVSRIAAEVPAMHNMWQDKFNQARTQHDQTDPNDLTFTNRFMDAFNQDPTVQGYTQKFSTRAGQQAAMQGMNGIRSNLFEHAHAVQMEVAGETQIKNWKEAGNQRAIAAANNPGLTGQS